MPRAKTASLFRIALLLAPLSLGIAACETLEDMNPLTERKTSLTGDRRALFPQGVPGVENNAPPQQPTNSNIQIQQQQAPEPAPEAQQQPQQQTKQPTQRNQKKRANAPEDPWADQRR